MKQGAPMKRSEFARSAPMSRGAAPAVKKPAPERKVRMRKCALPDCRKPFAPRTITHKACGPDCAELLAQLERARTDRKERQAGLIKLKRRVDWLKEAQAAFNAFIRARDEGDACISCGRYHDGKYDAGHYRSVGAMAALRFNELNVHRQCVPCNQHKSGNIVEYRLRLIKKIGREAVELLEIDHEPVKFSIEDAQRIKETYKAKLKALKASREGAQTQQMQFA